MDTVKQVCRSPLVQHALQTQGQMIHTTLDPSARREHSFQATLASSMTSACSDGPFSGRSNDAIAARFHIIRSAVYQPAMAAAPPVSYMRQVARRFNVSIATVRAAVLANSRQDKLAMRRIMCAAPFVAGLP